MVKENTVKVVKIGKEKEALLKNLVNLYLHDLSEFADDLKVNEEGKFEYCGIELYFKDEELNPFLIYFNDEVSGFILLNSGRYVPKEVDYSIHELFVLKAFRGKGVATKAIKNIFETYKGKYKVAQLEENKLAISFWKGFYERQNIEYKEDIEIVDNLNGYIQIFNSKCN